MLLWVSPDGRAIGIYGDEIDLATLGNVTISRASHVEPSPDGAGWIADLSPVNGPILGPFKKRHEALAAELAYLEAIFSLSIPSVRACELAELTPRNTETP
jgi:hypothetical protein